MIGTQSETPRERGFLLSQQLDFLAMFRRFIRRFQDHWQAAKRLVMHDPAQSFETDEPFANTRVAILMTAQIKQAVVDMQRV